MYRLSTAELIFVMTEQIDGTNPKFEEVTMVQLALIEAQAWGLNYYIVVEGDS